MIYHKFIAKHSTSKDNIFIKNVQLGYGNIEPCTNLVLGLGREVILLVPKICGISVVASVKVALTYNGCSTVKDQVSLFCRII